MARSDGKSYAGKPYAILADMLEHHGFEPYELGETQAADPQQERKHVLGMWINAKTGDKYVMCIAVLNDNDPSTTSVELFKQIAAPDLPSQIAAFHASLGDSNS